MLEEQEHVIRSTHSMIEVARAEAREYTVQSLRVVPAKLLAVAAVVGLTADTAPAAVLFALPLVLFAFDEYQARLAAFANRAVLDAVNLANDLGQPGVDLVTRWGLRTPQGQSDLTDAHRPLNTLLAALAAIGFIYSIAALSRLVPEIDAKTTETWGVLTSAIILGSCIARARSLYYWRWLLGTVAITTVIWLVVLWLFDGRMLFSTNIDWA